jgi:uncharacterized protein DUF3551
MRLVLLGVAAFVLIAVISPERGHSYDMPYDPYPWCAFYSGDGSGGTNCGFLTLEQCRATVSGIGGFCGPNQFYNPQRPAARPRKR